MELSDLLPNVLTEGLRFGSKEVKQVEKLSQDIRIGIEYEFFYLASPTRLAQEEYDKGEYQEIVDDFEALEYFSARLDGKDDIESSINFLDKANEIGVFDYFDRFLNVYIPEEMELVAEIVGFSNFLNRISDIQSKLKKYHKKSKEEIESLYDDRDYSTLVDLQDIFITQELNLISTHTEKVVRDKILSNKLYGKSKSQEEYVIKSVESELKSIGKISMNDIEDIQIEPESHSNDVMVEVITKPLPLLKSIEIMKNMFDYIQDVGYTDSLTGMHINISFKSLDFKIDNFNIMKLVTLLDLAYILGKKKEGVFAPGIFPPRLSVFDMFSEIKKQGNLEIYLLQMAMSTSFKEMELKSLTWMPTTKKFVSINFQHIKENNAGSRRIEFRFFGGDNYEDRFEGIVFQLYRTIYYMYAAFDEEFGKNEYRSLFLRWLNRWSEEVFEISFSELVKKTQDIDFNTKRKVWKGNISAEEVENIIAL